MGKFRKRTIKRTKVIKRRHLKRTSRLKSKRNPRYNGGSHRNTTIILMSMDGCGHCMLLKKTLDLLKDEIKMVNFIEMESKSIDYELLKLYNIESPRGFPTMVKIKNGHVYDEPPSRDINELRKWIKS